MTDFERFQEYGRLRRIAKNVDVYSVVFERNKQLYVALSSGQVIKADHLYGRSDKAVHAWLTILFMTRTERQRLKDAFHADNTGNGLS